MIDITQRGDHFTREEFMAIVKQAHESQDFDVQVTMQQLYDIAKFTKTIVTNTDDLTKILKEQLAQIPDINWFVMEGDQKVAFMSVHKQPWNT